MYGEAPVNSAPCAFSSRNTLTPGDRRTAGHQIKDHLSPDLVDGPAQLVDFVAGESPVQRQYRRRAWSSRRNP